MYPQVDKLKPLTVNSTTQVRWFASRDSWLCIWDSARKVAARTWEIIVVVVIRWALDRASGSALALA